MNENIRKDIDNFFDNVATFNLSVVESGKIIMERTQVSENCDLIYDQYPVFHNIRKFDDTKKPWTKITIAKKTRMLYNYAKEVTNSVEDFNRLYYHLIFFLNSGKINKCANIKICQGKIIDILNIETYIDENGTQQYSICQNNDICDVKASSIKEEKTLTQSSPNIRKMQSPEMQSPIEDSDYNEYDESY